VRIPAPLESAARRPSDGTGERGDRFLPRPAFKALAALAEVVVDAGRLAPERVAGNVDRYMASFTPAEVGREDRANPH
jgi:hypothetical protein